MQKREEIVDYVIGRRDAAGWALVKIEKRKKHAQAQLMWKVKGQIIRTGADVYLEFLRVKATLK